MLTKPAASVDPLIASVRAREFSRLDRDGVAYLDYTGAALYPECVIRSHHALLESGLFGNPHAENDASRASTEGIEAARRAVLRFLDADPERYTVCFTANATAAIKLVAESFPFTPDGAFVLAADNHNSVNGIREYARRAGASVEYIPLDDELRMKDPARVLRGTSAVTGRRLFAFPAQSNFSGVQHPLSLIDDAHTLGFDVLLDAAAFAPSNAMSLREHSPAFVTLSFYKIFGYPTGVGALILRRDLLPVLERPWFAGGTVDYVSVQNKVHGLKPGVEAFEDGTPDFLNISSVADGIAFIDTIGLRRIHDHVARLTKMFLDGVAELRHPNGAPLVRVYGPLGTDARGGTISFNVLSSAGRPVPYDDVERRAHDARIAVRCGCFCNPGAAEQAFAFDAAKTLSCLGQFRGHVVPFSMDKFRECLGGDTAVGAVRVSFGLANAASDVERALELIESFREESA